MYKRHVLESLVLAMGLIFGFGVLSCFADESITITTYYPSPYGSYKELTTYAMKIGSNYSGVGTNFIDNSLIVEGTVIIGATSVPATAPKLYVGNGNIEATGFYAFETNGANAFIERGTDNDGIVNFGGWNTATSSFTTTNIDGAPLILQSRSGGNVGIGRTPGAYKLYIDGAGYLGAAAWVYSSDMRLKENISPIQSGLDVVGQLNPVKFDYIKGEKRQVGFIAQEVEKILPDIITQGADEMLGMKTESIIPYLVKAIQEQQKEIDSLKARLDVKR